MDEKIIENLLKRASDIQKFAYAPYSKFQVGAAILLDEDVIVEGVNIENAAFPVTLCAERSAMAPIISHGRQNMIRAVAVVTKASPPGSPCGMCRQFLAEFLDKEVPIILGNLRGERIITSMGDLLPHAFDKSALSPCSSIF